MAILVTPPQQPLGFSRDRIVWQFEDDLTGYDQATAAQNVMAFSGAVAPGTRVVFRWKDQELRLTASASPADSGAEFPAGDGSQAYVDSLVPWFQTNFFVNEDFVVSASVYDGKPALFFSARQGGAIYNAGATNFTGGQILCNTPGLNSTRPANASVYVEVWLGDHANVNFHCVYRAPIELDNHNQATIDVAPLLHPLLTPEFYSYTLPVSERCYNSKRKYYLVYARAGGETNSIGQISQTETYNVVLGALNSPAGPVSLVQQFKGANPEQDRFLMLQDRMRYVRPDEPVFVSWINYRGNGRHIRRRIIITYQDGTNRLVDDLPVDNVITYDKLLFAAGYSQLDLTQYEPAKIIREYTVQLWDQDGPASEILHCLVDYSPRRHVRYFSHINCYGAVEVVKTFGKESSEWKLFRDKAEQLLPLNYSSTDSQYREWNHSFDELHEVATGFIPKKHLVYFLDFLMSAQKYRIGAGLAYPITINSESVKRGKDGDNLHGLNFAYQYARKGDAVSELLTDLDDPQPQLPPGVQLAGDIIVPPPANSWGGGVDLYPKPGSNNVVVSGTLYEIMEGKQDRLTLGGANQLIRGDGSLVDAATFVKANQEHRPASRTQAGQLRIATPSEAEQGINDNTVITPLLLKNETKKVGKLAIHPSLAAFEDISIDAGSSFEHQYDIAAKLQAPYTIGEIAEVTAHFLPKGVNQHYENGLLIIDGTMPSVRTEFMIMVKAADGLNDRQYTAFLDPVIVPEEEPISVTYDLFNMETGTKIRTITNYETIKEWNSKLNIRITTNGKHNKIKPKLTINGQDSWNGPKYTIPGVTPPALVEQSALWLFGEGGNSANRPTGAWMLQWSVYQDKALVDDTETHRALLDSIYFTLQEPSAPTNAVVVSLVNTETNSRVTELSPVEPITVDRPDQWDLSVKIFGKLTDWRNIRLNKLVGGVEQSLGEHWDDIVPEITDADWLIFALNPARFPGSPYGPSDYRLYVDLGHNDDYSFREVYNFTLTGEAVPEPTVPTISAQLYNANSTPAQKVNTIAPGASYIMPEKWTILLEYDNLPHNSYLLQLYVMENNAWRQRFSLPIAYATRSNGTLDIFNGKNNTDVEYSLPLYNGSYRLVFNTSMDGMPVKDYAIEFALNDPGQTPTGDYTPKFLMKGDPNMMNIVVTGSSQNWKITDNAPANLDSGYEWWYFIGNKLIKSGSKLNNYPWTNNDMLRVLKFACKIGGDTLNRWSTDQSHDGQNGQYYDFNFGKYWQRADVGSETIIHFKPNL